MSVNRPHPQRCETCKHTPDRHNCMKLMIRLSESDKDVIARVGCASHSNFTDDDPFGLNTPNNESIIRAREFVDACERKFRKENPCPKCGSHNVNIDWGTPIFCLDCGHEWD